MPTEREWAGAFRRLDSGLSSYEAEAKRLGVGKGTVYRHHIAELQRRINMKKSELSRIMVELSQTQQNLQALQREKMTLEGEISQAREKLSTALQELNQVTSTYERLQKLGLQKVSELAEFIEDIETLKFDSETVRKLAEWRRALSDMGINLDTLGKYVSLEIELRNLKEKVGRLKKLVETLEKTKSELLRNNTSLYMLSKILESRRVNVPCKVCGWPLPILLDRKENYMHMINQRLGLNVWCPKCGNQNWLDPREIILSVGWAVIQ